MPRARACLKRGGRARARAQRELEALRAENSDLKRRHSDEQLRLSKEHINELAAVRRRLEEQRRLDVEAASSETRLVVRGRQAALLDQALEVRHHGEVETLKQSSEQWEEGLRISY